MLLHTHLLFPVRPAALIGKATVIEDLSCGAAIWHRHSSRCYGFKFWLPGKALHEARLMLLMHGCDRLQKRSLNKVKDQANPSKTHSYPVLLEVPKRIELRHRLRHVGILSQCGQLLQLFLLVDGPTKLRLLLVVGTLVRVLMRQELIDYARLAVVHDELG